MSLTATCSKLANLLQEELERSTRLLAVLEAEHVVIAGRDTDALQQIIAEKQELLGCLERSHEYRLQLLQTNNLAMSQEGLTSLLQQCGDKQNELSVNWSEIRSTLAACQLKNQQNGVILATSRRVTRDALAILLGDSADNSELYNQSGKATTSSYGGHRLTKV